MFQTVLNPGTVGEVPPLRETYLKAFRFMLLARILDRLMQVEGIAAVYYDLTNKPPGTIEWE